MNKLRFLLLLVLIFVVSVFTGTAQDAIKVGAIFDLSGPTSDVGAPYADGVLAYIDWVNSNGGIEGHMIELSSQDYAYSVDTAESLYTQFVEEGVVVFMGWGTGDTEALRGRIAEDEIPFMSASYSAALADPNDGAPYNFLVGTTYSDQLIITMQLMMDEWVAEGNDVADMFVTVFHHDSPFGTSPVADGQAWAEEAGIGYASQAMPGGATDLTAELSAAEANGTTHIVIQNVSSPAATLLRNAEDIGLLGVIEFGCLNWCADEITIELAGSAADGLLGAIPFAPLTVEVPGQADPFAYAESVGYEDMNLHYTQGWSTMAVMAEGIRLTLANGQDLTGPNIRANLETLEDFDTGGITAPITFTAEDHRGNRSLTMSVVEDGVWVAAGDPIDLRAGE